MSDLVDTRLVKRTVISKRSEIEFQALALDTELLGNIAHVDQSIVRLSSHWTEARELQTIESDDKRRIR